MSRRPTARQMIAHIRHRHATQAQQRAHTAEQPAGDPVLPPQATPCPDELKHGYTLADLHGLTRLAVHVAGKLAADWHERYDTAWSAIAEHLYAAETCPTRHDLVRAGRLAIYAVIDADRQAYGYYRRKTDGTVHGVASSPAFRAYWWDLCGATPARSPEGPITERHALHQILPALTPTQREAITALAVHDDYRAAADALGMTYATFKSHVARGRNRFLAWWHEGEVPSKVWGTDRRVGSYAAGRKDTVRENVVARRRRASAGAS